MGFNSGFKGLIYLIYHHHHISVMGLGHLLTRSGLTYPEVSSKVCHDSFWQLGSSVSLPWVFYYETFYLHIVSSFSCIPVIYLKFVLFLIPLQLAYFFCNLSECILLFFSNGHEMYVSIAVGVILLPSDGWNTNKRTSFKFSTRFYILRMR